MDLISRKAAIEAVKIPDGAYPNPSERHGIIIARVEAKRRIMEIPSVLAVPLDKLCALLAKNADCPPEHSPVQDHCKENCAECWKSVLQEWMEEQDAAD